MNKSSQLFWSSSLLLFILALVVLSIPLFLHLNFLDTAWLPAVPQEFGGVYPFRSLFFGLSSALFVAALVQLKSPKKGQLAFKELFPTPSSWGIVKVSAEEPVEKPVFSITIKELVLWLIVLLSAISLALFLFKPSFFSKLSEEDGVIENCQAVLLFLSCGAFIHNCTQLWHLQKRRSRFLFMIALVLSVALFFLAMEEVSWFQRVLSIKTPQSFAGNQQNELNLHNFATSSTHTVYFLSTFFLFTLLPFLKENMAFIVNRITLLDFFIPDRFVLFSSVMAVAYTYGNWSEPLYQLVFFITLSILIYYSCLLFNSEQKTLIPTLTIIYLLTQILIITLGESLKESWLIGEYKELFIPLSFLLYSLEIRHKTNKLKAVTGQENFL